MTVQQVRAKDEIYAAIAGLLDGADAGKRLSGAIAAFPNPSLTGRAILDQIPHAIRGAAEAKNGSGFSDVLALIGSWGIPCTRCAS